MRKTWHCVLAGSFQTCSCFLFLHSLDQCGRVLELLKQYHNFKSILTALIQKEENAISLQASYMGKENLKKRIAEVSPHAERAEQ